MLLAGCEKPKQEQPFDHIDISGVTNTTIWMTNSLWIATNTTPWVEGYYATNDNWIPTGFNMPGVSGAGDGKTITNLLIDTDYSGTIQIGTKFYVLHKINSSTFLVEIPRTN